MNKRAATVQATETSFRIIESIEREGAAGVSELGRRVDLSKSAVYKHVQTLERLGYLVRIEDEYHLSTRFVGLGSRAGERLPMDILRDAVDDLAETTGHISNFIAHEGRQGVYVVCVDEHANADATDTEGNVAPLHATAGGKAILAFLPSETRETVLDAAPLGSYTDKTITDRQELERELQSVRDRRVAFNREEYLDGHQCVASPVLDADSNPIGAVCVAGVTAQMSGKHLEEEMTGLTISSAKSIENELLSASVH